MLPTHREMLRIKGYLIDFHVKELQMNKLVLAAKQFWKDESGVTAIEYGLIAALIAVAIAATLGPLGTEIAGLFTTIAGAIPN